MAAMRTSGGGNVLHYVPSNVLWRQSLQFATFTCNFCLLGFYSDHRLVDNSPRRPPSILPHILCGICGGQSGSGIRFFASTRVLHQWCVLIYHSAVGIGPIAGRNFSGALSPHPTNKIMQSIAKYVRTDYEHVYRLLVWIPSPFPSPRLSLSLSVTTNLKHGDCARKFRWWNYTT